MMDVTGGVAGVVRGGRGRWQEVWTWGSSPQDCFGFTARPSLPPKSRALGWGMSSAKDKPTQVCVGPGTSGGLPG